MSRGPGEASGRERGEVIEKARASSNHFNKLSFKFLISHPIVVVVIIVDLIKYSVYTPKYVRAEPKHTKKMEQGATNNKH